MMHAGHEEPTHDCVPCEGLCHGGALPLPRHLECQQGACAIAALAYSSTVCQPTNMGLQGNRVRTVQVCNGVIDGYLFVYLDMLGAPPALLGLCLLLICCVELPVFAWSGPILNFLGYSGALHLALAAFCCRLTVYATLHFMPSCWFVAPFEMLHGITFAIAWAAGVNYCKAMAPEGLKSTIQSLFMASYSGLGRGLGGLVGGMLLNRFGGPALFTSALVWTLCGWALIGIGEWLLMCYTPELQN